MELENIVKKNKEYKINRVVTIIAIIGSLAFSAYTFSYSAKKVEEAENIMRYLDSEGNVYTTRPIEKIEARKKEAKDQIKDYYTLIYQFDKYTYTKNMKTASKLAGRCYDGVVDQYERQEVFEKLISLNMRLNIEIDSIMLEYSKENYLGIIYGKQTSIREISEQGTIKEIVSKRNLHVAFEATDISRSDENLHGILIKNWKAVNWDEIK